MTNHARATFFVCASKKQKNFREGADQVRRLIFSGALKPGDKVVFLFLKVSRSRIPCAISSAL
jgi:hypothetical protein